MALLEVSEITKKFGGLIAVNRLSLSIEQGEIVALIGPNGAGKTTAFNVISGYYKPDYGKVHFGGKDITGLRPDQICRLGLARTFQICRPFCGISVLDNVMVGAYSCTNNTNAARKKALEVLDFIGMADLADQPAGNLPIGWRKKLEIARSLATSPKLLLLDESMAGLRPCEINETIEIVRKVAKSGTSILLVEHVMKVVMSLAQRIVVLHHGEKIAEGDPESIVKNQQVIDAYLGEAYVTGQ
jgi:branched-chain amino acid transport system ATP-binding protein